MDLENKDNNDNQVTNSQESPKESQLTMADVQRMIAEAEKRSHDAAFAEARRLFEEKGKKAKKSVEPEPALDAQEIVQREIGRHTAVIDQMGEYNLTPAQRRRVLNAFKAENPDDPSEWVKEYLTDLGLASPKTETKKTDTQPQTPNPTPPVPQRAVPASSVPTDQPDNTLTWDKNMIHAYVRQRAEDKVDLYHPRNRAAWDEFAKLQKGAFASRNWRFWDEEK